MSRTRRRLYRAGSILGDLEAIASGDPGRVARRYVRKSAWRAQGRATRRVLRRLDF